MSETRDLVSGRLVFGIALLVFGTALTLGNLSIIDATSILAWWPMTIVLWGVLRLTGFCCRRRTVTGAALLVLGVYLQARMLFGGSVSGGDVWAVILVLAGVLVLAGPHRLHGGRWIHRRGRGGPVRFGVHIGDLRRRGFDVRVEDPEHPTGEAGVGGPDAGAAAAEDRLSAFAVLGSVSQRSVSTAFRGGDVGAVFGGAQIDLRGARIQGDEAVLDVVAVIGGVDLFVPDGWRVVSEVVTILGAFEDKTRVPPADARATLRVRGVVLLGAIEVKH